MLASLLASPRALGDKFQVMTDTPPSPASVPPAMPLDEQVAALARSALFRDVEPQQLRLLAFSATERRAATAAPVARAGDAGAPAFLVTAGAVETDGRRHGPGVLLNGEAALAGRAPAHDITAAVPSRLLVIDRALIARLIQEYPAMGSAMLRTRGRGLRGLAGAIRDAARPAAAPAPAPAPAPAGGRAGDSTPS